ncbi:H-NS family histone-like protein [Aeromonas veronii]|uniref:H-NS family histone-like protein n=1 Tax=Aeromonas veronii TaxID=654 RepID=UPI0022463ED0|nr:hypothetical protein [Aeromonas veronii]MCX0437103.1 hypothetical protein [Aeromonas veronii]
MNKEELERNVNIGVVSKALMSRDILREAIADLEVYDLDSVVERVTLLVQERKEQEKAAGIEAIKAQMKALGVDLSDLQGIGAAAHKPRKSSGAPRRSTTVEVSHKGTNYTVKSVGRPDPATTALFEAIGFGGKKKEFIEEVQKGAFVEQGVEFIRIIDDTN